MKKITLIIVISAVVSACQTNDMIKHKIAQEGVFCLNDTQYKGYKLIINQNGNEYVSKRWAETTKEACTKKATALNPPTIKKQKEISSICICGFNMYEYCDAGGGLHCISDCYDSETYDYCGYDDQYCGEC